VHASSALEASLSPHGPSRPGMRNWCRGPSSPGRYRSTGERRGPGWPVDAPSCASAESMRLPPLNSANFRPRNSASRPPGRSRGPRRPARCTRCVSRPPRRRGSGHIRTGAARDEPMAIPAPPGSAPRSPAGPPPARLLGVDEHVVPISPTLSTPVGEARQMVDRSMARKAVGRWLTRVRAGSPTATPSHRGIR
jgi:hypothetical protein